MSAQENTTELHVSKLGHLTKTTELSQGAGRVSCDGGGGSLGHPIIWLTLAIQPSGDALAVCPYCSRRFTDK